MENTLSPRAEETALAPQAPNGSPPALPVEELLPAQAPEPEAILMDLSQREQDLKVRERRFHARQHALALGLSEEILTHFDYTTDEALQNSLRVAALAMKSAASWQSAAIPRAAAAPAPAFATYLDRARLFAEDPFAYAQLVKDRAQQ